MSNGRIGRFNAKPQNRLLAKLCSNAKKKGRPDFLPIHVRIRSTPLHSNGHGDSAMVYEAFWGRNTLGRRSRTLRSAPPLHAETLDDDNPVPSTVLCGVRRLICTPNEVRRRGVDAMAP